jgi:two-component system response regulator GlrR
VIYAVGVEREDDAEAVAPSPGITTASVQIETTAAGAHALVSPLTLRVVEGPDAGGTFTASSDRVVVGTHERADMIVRDRTVSRFHCELAITDGRVVVRDLESRNGTRVNGVSILAAHLDDGALLTLGGTRLAFALGRDPVRVALSPADRFAGLVGRSVAARTAFGRLDRAASSDATALIEGETGTGKELAAEAIHGASRRAGRPFIVVDCGAIPPDLLESELFGHERGAFTGAVSARPGAFEAAHGGTIFLDEIGELSLPLQPKLLRALEKREVKRIGQTRYTPVDVRVIAATNRNLRGEVNAGRFRADLYYRLAVLEIRLPPLRERREDLTLLVEHFLRAMGAVDRPEAALLRNDACRAELARHAWPGNVRELRNYVERCLALAEPPVLACDRDGDGPTSAAEPSGSLRTARESWVRGFEKQYLEDLLARHGDNVSAAARAAGVDRKYFYRLLWRNGLRGGGATGPTSPR